MTKRISSQAKFGLTTGDQVFDGVNDASNFYQLDASSDSALTGTLTVIYSVPGVDRMKVLKDSAGVAVTINLADPKIVSITGLHFDRIGVRPTVAVAGGTYDIALTTEAEGDASRA